MSSDSGFIANSEDGPERSGAENQQELAETMRNLREDLREAAIRAQELKAWLEATVASALSTRQTEPVGGVRHKCASARQPEAIQWLRADLALNRHQRRIEFYDSAGRLLKRRTLRVTNADLLTVLVDTPQKPHSREELAARIGVAPHTVSKIIGRLRELCEDNDWTLIQTVHGKGYALYLSA